MVSAPSFDEDNVQGDILYGLPKFTETFLFFRLVNVQDFQRRLPSLLPLITTSAKAKEEKKKFKEIQGQQPLQKVPGDLSDGAPDAIPPLSWSGVNIAFSSKGLTKMGVKQDKKGNDLNDDAFRQGMTEEKAIILGDSFAEWQAPFKQKDRDIDGLIMIAGDTRDTVDTTRKVIEKILGFGDANAAALAMAPIIGDVRKEKRGFEHFGFRDGISQPAIEGIKGIKGIPDAKGVRRVSKDAKSPSVVGLGKILLGREGDSVSRPAWAVDGSFLCFRYLSQKVPEFDEFLKKQMPANPEFLGAQLMGRWKSGAPIDLAENKDNPDLAQSNLFTYHKNAEEGITNTRCPLGAHTRKANPRGDLDFLNPFDPKEPAPMLRRGIPFGPEVSADEAKKTIRDRGLLFVSYQSNIGKSFEIVQNMWANNAVFPVRSSGIDPFISTGRTLAGPAAQMGVRNVDNQGFNVPHEDWVTAKGGGYFFSPSIRALSETLSLPPIRTSRL